MADAPRGDLVVETSTLINLLAADLLGTVARHPRYRLIITDHVRSEITDEYPEEQASLRAALDAGHVVEVRVESDEELRAFAKLVGLGQLGVGECAAIAAAVGRHCPIAIDDRVARKVAGRMFGAITLVDTEGLMMSLIEHSLVSVERADEVKALWEERHKFKLPFKSFRDRIR